MIIRPGKKSDIPQVFELIKELAEYEKALDKVSNTVEKLEEDGFGPNPVYELFVAEIENNIVGIALTYYRFSTWRGKVMYLEDLIVREHMRRKGIGKKLFDMVLDHAKVTSCVGLSLQVLDWNDLGINFYKKYNMEFDDEWINCYLEF
ncbi:MAG: GNAT family N-acetyltransferase [Flammeovirgaceae bacterium]|nr:GNAT family N-acetyltransferase [Flammeovirgaceae bacterium]|tara:strand:- start:123 stop:566 length:444 start_codon:yes stop_codon:yes gene_type:complete